MKLSVVIPAYNIAEYIGECLDSVIRQIHNDLEIIVVNDGSTDNTREVIRRYENDPRIVVIDKENGGLSDARNVGIDAATGDLITFVDGDDIVSDDAYARNILFFEQDPALDMIQYPVFLDWKSNHAYLRKPSEKIISGNEIFPAWWENELLIYSACNKIFRSGIFRSIRYPVGQCFEDMYIVPDLTRVVRKILISENGTYYYRYREGSILNSQMSYPKHRDQLDAMLRIYSESLQYPAIRNDRAGFLVKIIWWQLYSLHHFTEDQRNASIRAFSRYSFSWIDLVEGQLSFKFRIRIVALKLCGFRTLFQLFQQWKSVGAIWKSR